VRYESADGSSDGYVGLSPMTRLVLYGVMGQERPSQTVSIALAEWPVYVGQRSVQTCTKWTETRKIG
jgi:hypothetical protein